jgi:hypothetical protein
VDTIQIVEHEVAWPCTLVRTHFPGGVVKLYPQAQVFKRGSPADEMGPSPLL